MWWCTSKNLNMLVNISDIHEENQYKRLYFARIFSTPPPSPKNKNAYQTDIENFVHTCIWRLLNNQPQTTVLFKFSMNMFMKLNYCHAADAQWYMFYSKYIALPTYISINLLEITSLPFTTEIGDPLCIPFFFLQLIRLFYSCKRI